MNEQLLDLSALRIDGDTQPRTAIDQIVVQEYAEALQRGAEFPPVQVIRDGANCWLVDGFHRYYAHRRLNRPQIKAVVSTGLQAEAQWQSLAANKTHGLRRTNLDKAKAVRRALQMRPDLSDREIGDHVGVHFNTVAKYRESLRQAATITKCDSRTGRDGRTIRTANIRGASARPRPSGAPGLAKGAFAPVRTGKTPAPMKALSMPCDPVMGARTLIELFPADYLRPLVEFLTQHLQGVSA